jgi:NAD(P)-dependent dehydrogenase (short-subunit alcohol dehydrogenase family)
LLVRAESKRRWAELFEEWRKLGELRIVEGDVALQNLGLRDVNLTCDHVFHLAALYDLEADPQQLERVNAGGTRNLIAALRKSGFTGTLHHVSSVAVAGDFSGTFEEDRLDVGQSHPHPYHQSKFDSEKMVRDLEDIRYRIYRPSAVVGHSKTGAMDRIDGPYFLFEAVYKLRETLPRWMPLMSYQGTEINMVPVDWVAAAIDRLAHAPGQDRKTFHLADPSPPHFVDTFNLIADAAGAPRLPKKKGMLRRLMPGVGDIAGKLGSAQFFRSRMMEDFGIPRGVQAAINREVHFDTKNADAVLGAKFRAPPQDQYVEVLWDWYKRNLASARHKDVRNRKFFVGKKALITGASSGIGESMAKKLAAAGAEVILVARRDAELAEVAEGIRATGGKADWVRADLADLEECDRVVRTVLEKHGHVDILVNNAGHSIRRPLAESLERFHDLQRVMQINFFAPARLIRGFLPLMRERRRGYIVNVLSAGAHMPSPRFGAYTASKAALSQLGDTLAAEHAAEDIQVTQAYLHWVRTPMMEATGQFEDNPAMTPDEAADWMIDGVVEGKQKLHRATDARRYILNTIAPRAITRIINVVYRIYSDDPSAHPELELDRTFAAKIFRGKPM